MVGLAVRFGLRAARGAADFWASGYSIYETLSRNLVVHGMYSTDAIAPSAFRVPLYPLFLAATGGGHGQFWTVLVAQSAVSAGTIVLTGLIARRLFSPACGLLAAAMLCLWPYGAMHDTALQETGLLTFLTAMAVLLLLRLHEQRSLGTALAVGIVLAACVLTRAAALPFALVALAWLLVPQRENPVRLGKRLGSALAVALAMGAMLAPWLAYSHQVTGRAGLGTETGAALYAAHHDLTFLHFPDRTIDESRAVIFRQAQALHGDELAGLDTLERDDWFRAQAEAEIAQHPERLVTYGARKLWAAFGPILAESRPGLRNVIYAVSWTPVLFLALLGLWLARRDWRRLVLLVGLVGSFAAVTVVYWAQTSHKSYLDPYFIILAAFALAQLGKRLGIATGSCLGQRRAQSTPAA